MREIKFRAWDILNKKMHYDGFCMATDGTFWQYADHGYLVNNLNADEKHKAYLHEKGIPIQDEFVLMQYTGLKDKNGKEIYEGDIVTCKMSYNGGGLPHRGVIEYDSTFGAFCTKNDAGQTLLHNHLLNTFEVIGNLYENPNLLQ